MKNLKKIGVLLFLTLLISCGGSDDDNPTGGDAFLTAKVAGVDFASMEVSVGASVTSSVLAVQGSNANGDYIRLTAVNYNGVGTYKTGNSISSTNSAMYGSINPIAAWTSTFNIGEGTIEVTEDNSTHVKGTFSFVGVNDSKGNKTITEGKFSAPKL